MKVLSITEPFASLINEKKKYIETRSWGTKYRGEIYIHASSTKIPKEWYEREAMSLVENRDFKFGYIICKCKLVDCVYMTEEYINNIKENNYQEFICGEYNVGRYAWILHDIETLEVPISAKGNLGIWNYYNEYEIMDIMNNIIYGWMDNNGNVHIDDFDNFSDDYVLQSPNSLLSSKVGVCWDQVELERYYFKNNNWNIKTYFIVHYDNDKCPTHTFLTFEKDNKYYWFEHSWKLFKGIHEYTNEIDLLKDIKNKFIRNELHNNYEDNNLILKEYKKPNYNISVLEFFKHCEQFPSINI